MRLSEAIRLGAMLKPQCFNAMYARVAGNDVGSCALGAARDAGFDTDALIDGESDDPLTCPACIGVLLRPFGEVRLRLSSMIPHLNDGHQWTREQIADWVATVEPAQADDAVREDGAPAQGSSSREKVLS